jgi:hypothetical protein
LVVYGDRRFKTTTAGGQAPRLSEQEFGQRLADRFHARPAEVRNSPQDSADVICSPSEHPGSKGSSSSPTCLIPIANTLAIEAARRRSRRRLGRPQHVADCRAGTRPTRTPDEHRRSQHLAFNLLQKRRPVGRHVGRQSLWGDQRAALPNAGRPCVRHAVDDCLLGADGSALEGSQLTDLWSLKAGTMSPSPTGTKSVSSTLSPPAFEGPTFTGITGTQGPTR